MDKLYSERIFRIVRGFNQALGGLVEYFAGLECDNENLRVDWKQQRA